MVGWALALFGRTPVEHAAVRVARGAQAPPPDGAGGGRRDGVRGRDDRQDLRPRREDGARDHGAAGGRGRPARHAPTRTTRCASSPSAASRASRSTPTACSISIGFVTAMDLLRRGAQATDLRSIMRPATYAPETKRIDDLLREMQKGRIQLAVVVDEYGGAVGIVTIEDILEQIVGEIEDEHDRTPATVERLPDGSYRVAGRVSIDELNESLDWELPKGDFETVAGLVLATVNRIPAVGEVFHVGPYTFTVLEADERRILRVRITPPAPGLINRSQPEGRSTDGRTDGGVSEQRRQGDRIPGDAGGGQGPGRARDPGVVGPGGPHQESLRPLRGRRLLRPGPRHVSRPDGDRARRRRQALHGAQYRAGGEGPGRRGEVPRRPLLDRQAGRGGLLHGRPARAVRGHHQSQHRGGGGLLRHPSQREAGLLPS